MGDPGRACGVFGAIAGARSSRSPSSSDAPAGSAPRPVGQIAQDPLRRVSIAARPCSCRPIDAVTAPSTSRVDQEAAVHAARLTGHPGRILRQETHRSCDVIGSAEAAEGCPLEIVLPGPRVLLEPSEQRRGLNRARCDRVHGNLVRCELDRHALGQVCQRRLGGPVGGGLRERKHALGRGDVDDPTASRIRCAAS